MNCMIFFLFGSIRVIYVIIVTRILKAFRKKKSVPYAHVQCISNDRPLPRENIITFVLSVHVVHLGEDNLPFKNNTSWGKIIPKGKNNFL